MTLPHAICLAAESVHRASDPTKTFPKGGTFTKTQQGYEDWEPVPVSTVPVSPVTGDADCGCGPEA